MLPPNDRVSIVGLFPGIGRWGEATMLNKSNGRIVYRFHARDLHLVMGPVAPGKSVRFRVLIDGEPAGAEAYAFTFG